MCEASAAKNQTIRNGPLGRAKLLRVAQDAHLVWCVGCLSWTFLIGEWTFANP